MSDHREPSLPQEPPGISGEVIVLHGEFEAADRVALARVVTALGGVVRDDLTSDATLLVVGERTRSLAALLGPSAMERRAETLAAAGQSLCILDEPALRARVEVASGVPTLREALEREARGELVARVAPHGVSSTRHDARVDALLETLRTGNPAARVAAAVDLGNRGDPRAAVVLVEALRDAPHGLWIAATTALCQLGGDEAFAHACEALADPRAADRSVRRAIVRALETRGDGEALGVLAAALDHTRGAFGTDEAAVFGRMISHGVHRWGTSVRESNAVGCVVEWGESGEARAPDELLSIARRMGAVESLRDPRVTNGRVFRVSLDPRARVASGEADRVLLLIQRASTRRGARVWLAGCALPAALPSACWQQILAPLREH